MFFLRNFSCAQPPPPPTAVGRSETMHQSAFRLFFCTFSLRNTNGVGLHSEEGNDKGGDMFVCPPSGARDVSAELARPLTGTTISNGCG